MWIASECFTPSCLMCGTVATIICNAHFWEQFVPCWKYHVSEHRYKLDLRETKQHDTHMFHCTLQVEKYNVSIQIKYRWQLNTVKNLIQIGNEYRHTNWTRIQIEYRYYLNSDTNWTQIQIECVQIQIEHRYKVARCACFLCFLAKWHGSDSPPSPCGARVTLSLPLKIFSSHQYFYYF